MTASAPQSAERLLAVFPDFAELLVLVSLSEIILGSKSLHPDINVAEAAQTENCLRLCCPRYSYEEQVYVYDFGVLGR
jgi:hypothetical protein